MFRYNINFSSPVPIYQQIILAIKLEILSGRLKTNLEGEGFIESKRGSGNWVNYKNIKLGSLRKGMLEDEFRNFLERALSLGATREDIKKLIEKDLTHD